MSRPAHWRTGQTAVCTTRWMADGGAADAPDGGAADARKDSAANSWDNEGVAARDGPRVTGGGTRKVTDAGTMVPAEAASGGGNFGTLIGASDDAKAMHGVAAKNLSASAAVWTSAAALAG